MARGRRAEAISHETALPLLGIGSLSHLLRHNDGCHVWAYAHYMVGLSSGVGEVTPGSIQGICAL